MNQDTVSSQNKIENHESYSYKRAYILFGLFVLCTFLYYFGELVDIGGWESLQWSFFQSVHDIHRLFFLAPIIYTGYYFSKRAVVIISLITMAVFIPRALFISPYPDPVLRAETFAVIAGTIGYLVAVIRTRNKHISQLENTVRHNRDTLLNILERMADGVLITGPDYKVRFLNHSMAKEFGEGTGTCCYQYLRQSEKPCLQCKLKEILTGATERRQYSYSQDNIFDVQLSSFTDSDGTVCQLAIFRKTIQH